MKLAKRQLLDFSIVVFIFVISILLSSLYNGGDQIYYDIFYNNIHYFSFAKSIVFYKITLSSSEYVYFLLVWVFSYIGISHIVFISFFNALLAYVMLKLFHRWNVHILVSTVFILTNFYIYVLFFSAERLKFGVLFFVISMLFIDNSKKFFFYFALSIMSHIQLIILYASVFLNKVFIFLTSGNIFFINKWKLLVYVVSFFIVFFIMSDQLVLKFNSYSNTKGIEAFFKSFVFLIAALWYSKNKQEVVVLFIPLFFAIYFVGDIRIDMFSYFLFFYYAIQANRGLNLGVFVTSVYFMYKSFQYLYNIFEYGNGFYFG